MFLSTLVTAVRPRNLRSLLRFVAILLGLVCSFALLFQFLMAYEGQHHSIVTGFYWTLSTMSTLGYGDISFTSDAGRLFSIVVLLSGILFMLVLLPFTFIELFYEPWIAARAASRVPRSVPQDMEGHVILTFYGPVANALIVKLKQFNYPYVVILPELADVLRLDDEGINCIYGELNDPETYVRARVEYAALIATTRSDIVNTSVVFTVRGLTTTTPVVATARLDASVAILKLAGCSRVLDLPDLMANALARRALGGKQFSHVIGQIDDLQIAEVDAAQTTLLGMNYQQAQFETSVSIIGFWKRGSFVVGQPDSAIEEGTVLVMAGSSSQFREFDARYRAAEQVTQDQPVVIIGGGRVGRATAAALKRRGIDYRIVEQHQDRIGDPEKYVHGSASEKETLLLAGIEQAQTVIITPHDDETNIYLTIYCRLLREDIQIITRATNDQSVSGLHRAGSDIVMSYASMGSNALFNLLQRSDLLMVAEGLDVFKLPVPTELEDKSLSAAEIREQTGCSVIGIDVDGRTHINPSVDTLLQAGSELVLIGTPASEMAFLKRYPRSLSGK